MNPVEADLIQYSFGAIPRRLTNFIPESDAGIIGRDAELAETHRNLHTGRPAVLVNGIGGMGKTTIAAKYIVRYFQEYKHFAWLTVQGSLKESFYNNTALLDSLKISDAVRELVESRQSDKAFELVFKKLNDLGKTLVVLDNANDLADLVEMKKHFDRAHCHCLLTSRTQPPAWQIVEVKPLPDPDALALFRSHYPAPDTDDATIGALLAALDGHTLLIELVAKSAAASGIGVAELQRILREKFIHDPALNKRSVETGAHGDNLDTLRRAKVEEYIWLIFKNIAELTPTAQELLRAFALLPPATAFDEDFLEQHAAHFGIEGSIFDTLDRLVEHGWLEKASAPGQKPAYKMHPLIADVTLRHLDVNVEYAKTYLAAVAKETYYDAQNPEHNLFEINEKRPLAERLSDLFFEENTEEVSELLDKLRLLDRQFGFYQKAAYFGRRALDICENILEEGHFTIAVRQSNLAVVLQDLGDYEGAKKLLEKSLTTAEKIYSPDHVEVSVRQSNLAVVLRGLGDYEGAKNLLEKALASTEKNFGKEHPYTAVRYSNLALVLRDLGDYEGAKNLLEKALASDEKNFGKEQPRVANRRWILATILIQTGQKAEAKPLLESARRIFIEKLGPGHPYVAQVESWFSKVE